jgi:hypothetical protein
VTKQLPSLVPEKILMARHDAGWSYGRTRADFTSTGLLDATATSSTPRLGWRR